MKEKIKENYIYVILSTLILIAGVVFAYYYVYNESPVYIFDYSGYFESYKLMGNLLKNNFNDFISTLINSIRNLDYNYSSIIFLLPFYLLFGGTRLSYIISMTVCYVVPSIILTWYMLKTIFNTLYRDVIDQKLFYVWMLLLIFTYSRYWSPTLRGLSDISIICPIILSFIIVYKHRFDKKQNLITLSLLGFLIYLPFLFRRWCIYVVIAFYISMFLIDLFNFIKSKEKAKLFWIYFRNYFISGLTTFFSALLFQLPFLKRILFENYGDAYNGYQTLILGHIYGFISEFGIIIVIGALLGFILSIIYKKYLYASWFSFLNILIFWLGFGSIQSMGVHHFLGISLWVIILFVIFAKIIFDLIKNNVCKYLFLIILLLVFTLNFATTYIFRNSYIPIISQKNSYYKLRYYNYDELIRLIDDMEVLMKNPEKYENNPKFSVLSESLVLSDNLIDLLGNVDIKDNIVYATHVDSRDGINFNSLFASYIVVTDISQLGTNSNGQYVIDIPNKMIYNHESIGNAYELYSGPYLLDGNVNAYIYKKIRPFNHDEINSYFDSFYNIYPDWIYRYSYLDRLFLKSDIYRGANWGDFKRISEYKYYFYPGNDDTVLSIPINNELTNLKLKFYVDYNGIDENAGIVNVKIFGDKKLLVNLDVSSLNDEYVELNLSKYKQLKIVVSAGDSLNNDWLYMNIVDYDCKRSD